MPDTCQIRTRVAKIYLDMISGKWVMNLYINDINIARKRFDTFNEAKAAAVDYIVAGEYDDPATFRLICDVIT